MPAYILPDISRAGILDGTQRLVLAAPRPIETTAPHAIVGDDVFLRLARIKGRGGFEQLRPPRRCILRACLVMAPDAVVRVLHLRFREHDEWTAQAEPLARFLLNAEQGMATAGPEALRGLALRAGFSSWGRAWDWHSAPGRRGDPDAQGRIVREVIGFSAP